VRTDLYAVGAVMVEALTGTRPGPDAVDLAPVPAPLQAVAAKAVASNPEERYASAEQMLQALATLQRDQVPRSLVLTSSAPPATRLLRAAAPPPPDPTPSRTQVLPAAPRPAALPAALPAAQRRHRHRLAGLAIGGFALAAALGVAAGLVSSGHPGPTHSAARPPAPRTVHTVARPTDPVGTQLRAAAATIAAGTLPGDAVMAQALDAAAAQPAGSSRVAVAQEALALADVLSVAGTISTSEYGDAVTALEATGASPAALPVDPSPLSTPSSPPAGQPPGHDHGGRHRFGAGFPD
jgi:hypothetical protein